MSWTDSLYNSARAPPRRPRPKSRPITETDAQQIANLPAADDLFRQLADHQEPHRLTSTRPLLHIASEANRRTMSPPTWEDTPHLGVGSRYRPTPAADGRTDRPLSAAPPPAQESRWPPAPDPGDRPQSHPPTSPGDPVGLVDSSTSALAMVPEVLTAREAAAILRVGRNQLYQAVARGQLGAIRIGRSIRIPRHALLALLASTGPLPASSHEQPRQPATQVRQGPP